MVDVSAKEKTVRCARASAVVKMHKETLERIKQGGIKKGDVLSVAQVAGINAAKRTDMIIPLCHPLMLTAVDISFEFSDVLKIISTCKTCAETGVEMEALTAVSAASLCVYDMCKAIDRTMEIKDIKLLEKSGGRSGEFKRAEVVAVCISSKKGERKREIESATLIENHGIENDAHAGAWHRQVSLLAIESADKVREIINDLKAGDFAENILTSGIDLKALLVGTRLRINDGILCVTQIGKECHSDCDIRKKTGMCVMPTDGIFAKVEKGTVIRKGDAIEVLK